MRPSAASSSPGRTSYAWRGKSSTGGSERERRGSSLLLSGLRRVQGSGTSFTPASLGSALQDSTASMCFPSQIEQERLDKVWPKLRVLARSSPPTNILWVSCMEWVAHRPTFPWPRWHDEGEGRGCHRLWVVCSQMPNAELPLGVWALPKKQATQLWIHGSWRFCPREVTCPSQTSVSSLGKMGIIASETPPRAEWLELALHSPCTHSINEDASRGQPSSEQMGKLGPGRRRHFSKSPSARPLPCTKSQ